MKNLVVDVFNKKNQYKENDQNQVKFDDPRWRTIVDVTWLRQTFPAHCDCHDVFSLIRRIFKTIWFANKQYICPVLKNMHERLTKIIPYLDLAHCTNHCVFMSYSSNLFYGTSIFINRVDKMWCFVCRMRSHKIKRETYAFCNYCISFVIFMEIYSQRKVSCLSTRFSCCFDTMRILVTAEISH